MKFVAVLRFIVSELFLKCLAVGTFGFPVLLAVLSSSVAGDLEGFRFVRSMLKAGSRTFPLELVIKESLEGVLLRIISSAMGRGRAIGEFDRRVLGFVLAEGFLK